MERKIGKHEREMQRWSVEGIITKVKKRKHESTEMKRTLGTRLGRLLKRLN